MTVVGVLVSIVCYRKFWDLDMVGAPAVTTIGDIVTLPFIVVTALIVMDLPFTGKAVLGAIVFVMIVAAFISFKRGTRTMLDVLREGLPLLIPLSLLGKARRILFFPVR